MSKTLSSEDGNMLTWIRPQVRLQFDGARSDYLMRLIVPFVAPEQTAGALVMYAHASTQDTHQRILCIQNTKTLSLCSTKVTDYNTSQTYNKLLPVHTDNSGTITTQEVRTVWHNLGLEYGETELRDFLKSFDEDGNGTISYAEFLKLTAEHNQPPQITDDEIRNAFLVFDKDGSGTINKKELKQALESLGTCSPTLLW